MEKYIVTGKFKAGNKWENFTKNITSQNENNARGKVYSLIGSEHGLKRNLIRLESVNKE
jgi:large subunit ribosomal protein LX